jgi:hypothetical protein
MLPARWRACTHLLHIGKGRCFAKKVLSVGQGQQDSSVTVRGKLKADTRNQKSKDSNNDHQALMDLDDGLI